jgi:hypothetical protein
MKTARLVRESNGESNSADRRAARLAWRRDPAGSEPAIRIARGFGVSAPTGR